MDGTGIIFGGYLLSKEDFIPLFKEWYEQKGNMLLSELETLRNHINGMIRKDTGSKKVYRTAEYNAQFIYQEWERIQKDYFGNDAITLIAITKFDDQQLSWSQNVKESEFMTPSGINITAAQFQRVIQNTVDAASTLSAAEEIQQFFRLHYAQMCTQLSEYNINVKEAYELHKRIPKNSALYSNRHDHFTGRTYDDIIYSNMKNAEGKRLDAFMNHVAQYNKQLFGLMSSRVANKNSLAKIKDLDTHGGFKNIFNNTNIVQPWLLASLNTTSWLTGGDVVVIDNTGAVIYNIQIKSTASGKNFELSLLRLESLISRLIQSTKSNTFKPEQLANIMYNSLKTTSSNQVQETEKFIESAAYELVRKNLQLK